MKVPRPSAALAFLVAFSICSFLTRIRLHRRYGWDWGQWPRVVLGIVLAFLTFPLRMTERLLTNKTLQRSRIFPPVFIVGHWRSGTTLLHTLISQDPQFGFVPSYQVFATKFSDLCEFEVAKKIINGLIPVNRDFDKVELKFEGPQEEEVSDVVFFIL
ncbi:hypothetical protein Pelo_4831 [Pelomyxa schiedti]|nr:hypothetical protein Pelo_4831 [Pelomyxa schiedti]